MINKRGFTLVEMLVVISLLSVVGVIILTIFSNTLKGTNKSQIISLIKQNGQSALENMDKTIRNAESVFCWSNTNIVVVNSDDTYTRYTFISPVGSTENGYIQKEAFSLTTVQANVFTINGLLCATPPYTGSDVAFSLVILTDNNPQTGVSVDFVDHLNPVVFSNNSSPGFPDQVTISFVITPGVKAPPSVAGQIDPETFQTTIGLRNNK